MEPLIRMRLMAVRIGVLLTVVAAAVAYLWDKIVAQGLLLGGVAGVLMFWVLARRLEKLATASEGKVYSLSVGWRLVELFIYAAVLGRAYALDRVSLRGLLAAVGGLFIIRLVTVFLGFTGLDLKREEK